LSGKTVSEESPDLGLAGLARVPVQFGTYGRKSATLEETMVRETEGIVTNLVCRGEMSYQLSQAADCSSVLF
jgi:hypothetical protein